MSEVFISYSRKDKDFVHQLHDALAAQGRDAWVDWEDIPATADWWREIQAGVDGANAFIVVISPDSVRSEVCRREVDYAVSTNKRLVPVLRRDIVDPEDQKIMHPAISTHNWIFFRETDDFQTAFQALLNALDTDLSHVRQHTRLLVRAKEWDSNGRNNGYLLQGDDLRHAEEWLAQGVSKKPTPTTLHAEYIAASRRAVLARQRRLLAGAVLAVIVSLALAVLALIQSRLADANAALANANASTAVSAGATSDANAATAVAAQKEAQTQATNVAYERDGAQSIAFAGQAQVELVGPLPERAALLGLYAFDNYRYTWQIERALASAVSNNLEHRTLTGHQGEVFNIAWSPNSTQVISSGADGTARVWDAKTGNSVFVLAGHTNAVNRAVWSPDGNRIATASSDDTARVWDAVSGTLLMTLSGHTDIVAWVEWSPDGKYLLTASHDNTVRVWDSTTGALLMTLAGHMALVNQASWSPDGTRIVSASDDGTARIWDAANGQPLFILNGHRLGVYRATWSPDGTRVATASADTTARIWDATTENSLFELTGHIDVVTRVAWSPDGKRVATASDDQTARIWDAEAGGLLRTLFGHTRAVTGVIWSVGGARLITVSQDRTARIWNSESGGELLQFSGHTNTIYSAAWSPDGERFATAGADGNANVWQVWATAQKLFSFAKRCCASRPFTDEEVSLFGLIAVPAVPPPSEVPACDGLLASRLYVGARGKVSDEDPSLVNVRANHNLSADIVGRVAPNQTFRVTSGPQCADNIAWFKIIYGVSAIQGWLAEGQNGQYFVEPVAEY